MKINIYCFYAIAILVISCSVTKNTKSSQTTGKTLPPIVYLIDSDYDGKFETIEIDKENSPKPIQGYDSWVSEFYHALKYPGSARENSISGIVILDIDINQLGKVTDVRIKQGISRDCDEAAKAAFIQSTKQGYWPLIINGVATSFRMEKPVGFWLE